MDLISLHNTPLPLVGGFRLVLRTNRQCGPEENYFSGEQIFYNVHIRSYRGHESQRISGGTSIFFKSLNENEDYAVDFRERFIILEPNSISY
jgi:hypothetical protein